MKFSRELKHRILRVASEGKNSNLYFDKIRDLKVLAKSEGMTYEELESTISAHASEIHAYRKKNHRGNDISKDKWFNRSRSREKLNDMIALKERCMTSKQTLTIGSHFMHIKREDNSFTTHKDKDGFVYRKKKVGFRISNSRIQRVGDRNFRYLGRHYDVFVSNIEPHLKKVLRHENNKQRFYTTVKDGRNIWYNQTDGVLNRKKVGGRLCNVLYRRMEDAYEAGPYIIEVEYAPGFLKDDYEEGCASFRVFSPIKIFFVREISQFQAWVAKTNKELELMRNGTS